MDLGWVIVVFAVLMVLALAFNLFGRRRGEIAKHPQGRRRGGGQKGAEGSGEFSGRDEAERTSLREHGTKP